jgi:hypothetical protein
MTQPTLGKLGMLGNTDEVEDALAGAHEAPPDCTDKHMKELLSETRVPLDMLKSIAALGPISTQITTKENKSGWKKRRFASAESSGPSMVATCMQLTFRPFPSVRTDPTRFVTFVCEPTEMTGEDTLPVVT